MTDTRVEAPKMFREMHRLNLTRVVIPDAQETLWHCSDVRMHEVEVHGADYLFMHSSDIDIESYRHQGNYSFQYCRNVEIRNAAIDSKDAFLEYGRCHRARFDPQRRISGLALQASETGQLPHIRHTAVMLRPRPRS